MGFQEHPGPLRGDQSHAADQRLPCARLLAARWAQVRYCCRCGAVRVEEDATPRRRFPIGRIPLNLHRMKKLQEAAELFWAVEARPSLREKTSDRSAARLSAADSAGSQNRRPRPEPPKPETRANRAFHRIPGQSRKTGTIGSKGHVLKKAKRKWIMQRLGEKE